MDCINACSIGCGCNFGFNNWICWHVVSSAFFADFVFLGTSQASILLNTMAATEQSGRPFKFERDTFAFPHELVWKYHFDTATGAMTTYQADPPPTYYHRCFMLVRATRLFFD